MSDSPQNIDQRNRAEGWDTTSVTRFDMGMFDGCNALDNCADEWLSGIEDIIEGEVEINDLIGHLEDDDNTNSKRDCNVRLEF